MDCDLAVGIAAQDRTDGLDLNVRAKNLLPHRREPTEPAAAEGLGDRLPPGERLADNRAMTVGGVALLRGGRLQIRLVIPVGLEKLTHEDINELHLLASEEDYEGPRMWPIIGTIITEIEALAILAGVDAYLYSAGGVAGAEGSVRMLVEGSDEEVEAALELVQSIKGEPRYLL